MLLQRFIDFQRLCFVKRCFKTRLDEISLFESLRGRSTTWIRRPIRLSSNLIIRNGLFDSLLLNKAMGESKTLARWIVSEDDTEERRRILQTKKPLEEMNSLTTVETSVLEALREGDVSLDNGRRQFKGEFLLGSPCSFKCRLIEEGDVYEGPFNIFWQRHGKAGRAWLLDGTRFVGRFDCDEMIEGFVQIPSGPTVGGIPEGDTQFEGTLRDECFLNGCLRQANGVSYSGSFENNMPHGIGTLQYPSGAKQSGMFRQGKLHGSDCQYRLENGALYLGEFVDGSIHSGELRTGSFHYEGSFDDIGAAHGEGRAEMLALSAGKRIFRGRWQHGSFVGGDVEDEFGQRVDYREVLEETIGTTAMLAQDRIKAKFTETRSRFAEMNKAFVEDATCKLKEETIITEEEVGRERKEEVGRERKEEVGTFPTRFDLGYERGPTMDAMMMERTRKDLNQAAMTVGQRDLKRLSQDESHLRLFPSIITSQNEENQREEVNKDQFKDYLSPREYNDIERFNRAETQIQQHAVKDRLTELPLAKEQLRQQLAAQRVMRDTLAEQQTRFTKEKTKENDKRQRRIQSNEPWVSLVR